MEHFSFDHNNNRKKELEHYVESVGDILIFYYIPIITMVGIVGNILSVVIFFCTSLKKISSSYYLAALSISDTCFLVLISLNWLNFQEISFVNQNVICEFYSFLQGVCSFLSVWFVVAFTMERLIVVLYPLKRRSVCTTKRAVIVLFTLTFFGCMFSLPLAYFFKPVYDPTTNSTVCDLAGSYKVSTRLLKILNFVLLTIWFFQLISQTWPY